MWEFFFCVWSLNNLWLFSKLENLKTDSQLWDYDINLEIFTDNKKVYAWVLLFVHPSKYSDNLLYYILHKSCFLIDWGDKEQQVAILFMLIIYCLLLPYLFYVDKIFLLQFFCTKIVNEILRRRDCMECPIELYDQMHQDRPYLIKYLNSKVRILGTGYLGLDVQSNFKIKSLYRILFI